MVAKGVRCLRLPGHEPKKAFFAVVTRRRSTLDKILTSRMSICEARRIKKVFEINGLYALVWVLWDQDRVFRWFYMRMTMRNKDPIKDPVKLAKLLKKRH